MGVEEGEQEKHDGEYCKWKVHTHGNIEIEFVKHRDK